MVLSVGPDEHACSRNKRLHKVFNFGPYEHKLPPVTKAKFNIEETWKCWKVS